MDPGTLRQLPPSFVGFAFLRGWGLEVPLALSLLLALEVIADDEEWEKLTTNYDRRSSQIRVKPSLDVAIDTLQFCYSESTPVPPPVDRFTSFQRLFPDLGVAALGISVMVDALGKEQFGESLAHQIAEAELLAELLVASLDGCAPPTTPPLTTASVVRRLLALASATYLEVAEKDIDFLELAATDLLREEVEWQVIARDIRRWRVRVASICCIDDPETVEVVRGNPLLQTVFDEYGPAVATRVAYQALLVLLTEAQQPTRA